MTGKEIREKFLAYFESKGHTRVPSSGLVPAHDPSLLFTNAGMVQFKRVFLGEESRPYSRAATAQKCVRAGGKHNDLENVGKTARHHTFFEMLGNFSFGDYFKAGAIEMAWELLTEHYRLPADRLWATVYHDDTEAADLWHNLIHIPRERIVGLGEKDNFWAMGDTGPCGPCSEIIIDQGEDRACGPHCGIGTCDCDRYLEIWNLVFMQYNRDEQGKLHPLPKPSIDTGMGLERLAAVIQGVPTNFDTDLLRPIIGRTEELAGQAYGRDPALDVAFKVIADHSRAITFLIADGVLPSNEGRGYVLRRILRRAVRFGRLLGFKNPFLAPVGQKVIELMGDVYPELNTAKTFIDQVVRNEEERFAETLDHGLKILSDELAELQAKGQRVLPGAVAFKLYDTYGFPLDLITDVLQEQHLALDEAGFEEHMTRQRQSSRQSWKGGLSGELPPAYQSLQQLPATTFVGYDNFEAESQILALVRGDAPVSEAAAGSEVEVVVATTPFYAEAGGQVADTGSITAPGLVFLVEDVQKLPNEVVIHKGKVMQGQVRVGQRVKLAIDADRRRRIAGHHTATHLLHAALRHRVGEHVKQAGSLVAPDRFRFDYSHFAGLSSADLAQLEADIMQDILRNLPVEIRQVSLQEALEAGAMALFDEKYGDQVRMVAVPGVSVELCGGTHVSRTGDIGLCRIVAESSVAAGIRRIEAVCGAPALAVIQEESQELQAVAQRLKAGRGEVLSKLDRLLQRQKELEKQVETLQGQLAAARSSDLLDQVRSVDGVQVLALEVDVTDPKGLRDFADKLKDRLQSGVIVLGSAKGEKAMLITVVTKDLTDRLHAGKIVGALAAMVGGKGGGRADMAQAGGPEKGKLATALAQAYDIVAKSLS
ncbi:MAG: alanine--tRNA ligase [Desulfobacca sp.]|uniref:alanine--tRNA ligase n=1 Tax=Desulfobacca sp. TaxID=2067990 RepID=UPI00404A4D62